MNTNNCAIITTRNTIGKVSRISATKTWKTTLKIAIYLVNKSKCRGGNKWKEYK